MKLYQYDKQTYDDDGEVVDHTWQFGIIKGIKGEFYPCKPDIFDATYEAQ